MSNDPLRKIQVFFFRVFSLTMFIQHNPIEFWMYLFYCFFGNAWEINQLPNQVTTLECQQNHFKTDKTINGRERMKIHFPTKPSRSQQGGILNLCDAPWAKGSEVFKPCWGWELLLILLSLLLNGSFVFFFNGLFVVERFLVSIKFEEIFYTSVSSYFLYETLNLKLRKRWALVIFYIQSQLVQVSLSFFASLSVFCRKKHEKCETWFFMLMFLNSTASLCFNSVSFAHHLLQAAGGRPPVDAGAKPIGRGSRLGRLVASAGSIGGGMFWGE